MRILFLDRQHNLLGFVTQNIDLSRIEIINIQVRYIEKKKPIEKNTDGNKPQIYVKWKKSITDYLQLYIGNILILTFSHS